MNRVINALIHLHGLSGRVGRAMSWISPSVARLTVGWIFLWSGWGKLHNLDQVTSFFTQLGLPAPGMQALLVSCTELVCGALVLAGAYTRLAAVPLMITMMVAIRTAQWEQVDSLGSLFGLSEFLYLALLLWLATGGPGPLSIDWLLDRVSARRSAMPLLRTRASGATVRT